MATPMKTSMTLTRRDRELLAALAEKVRLFSLRQIADHWWRGELANARRRLKSLERAGLISRITVSARTLPEVHTPVITWSPGEHDPDFGKAAYRLKQRWKGHAVRPTSVCIATDRAAQLFGATSRGRLKAPVQATHDLGVSAVWLLFKRESPEWAGAWRGEDSLAHTRQGQKLPDAFLVNRGGDVTGVIEFGGSYDAERVRDFHDDCVARQLPYQIW
jgi:hypothetical protein